MATWFSLRALRGFRYFALAACLALSITPRAEALIAFEDGFVPIDAERLEQLRGVKALAPFLTDDAIIHVGGAHYDDANTIHLVRFEGFCDRDACVTAIFLNGISDAGLSTLSQLPRLKAHGDTSVQVCASCPRSFPLIFEYADKRQTALVVINGKIMHAPVMGP